MEVGVVIRLLLLLMGVSLGGVSSLGDGELLGLEEGGF